MAEIDKALPNVRQTLNIPNPEEVAVAEQEAQQNVENPVDVIARITKWAMKN